MTGADLPPDMHPDVAAILREAKRLEDVLEDRLHQIRTGRFTASDEARTVEVTLDGEHRLVDVFITEGALRKGLGAIQSAVNEALVKANADVDASASAGAAKINAVLAEITGIPVPTARRPR